MCKFTDIIRLSNESCRISVVNKKKKQYDHNRNFLIKIYLSLIFCSIQYQEQILIYQSQNFIKSQTPFNNKLLLGLHKNLTLLYLVKCFRLLNMTPYCFCSAQMHNQLTVNCFKIDHANAINYHILTSPASSLLHVYSISTNTRKSI